VSYFCNYIIDDACINKILNATGISSPQYTIKANGMKEVVFQFQKKMVMVIMLEEILI